MALSANQNESGRVANKRTRLVHKLKMHLRLFRVKIVIKNLPSSFIWIFAPFFYPIQGCTDRQLNWSGILFVLVQSVMVRGSLILSLFRFLPQNIPNHSMHGIIFCLLFSRFDFYFLKTDL